MESQQRVIKSYEWSVTGGLQRTESEMTSLEKDMVRNDNFRNWKTGRSVAFFWG